MELSNYCKTVDGQKYQIGAMVPSDCFRCGICCQRYQPWLTFQEMEEIAQKLGITGEEFRLKYIQTNPKNGALMLRHSGNGCISLSREEGMATCTIHPFRPTECRNFTPSLSHFVCREGLAKLKLKGGYNTYGE